MRDTAYILATVLATAHRDAWVVGVVNYGSSSEGRSDLWSDLDIAIFIRDADYDAFQSEWHVWASQFGTMMLGFVANAGHVWAIYDAPGIPIRCDYAFHAASAANQMRTWPNAPESAEAMVLYDGMNGRLTALAGELVRQSLAPRDLRATFDNVCGSFWYYLLRTLGRVHRGAQWDARFSINFMLTGNLAALMRIEAHAVDRWRAADAVSGIERVLSARRLNQLNACIPPQDAESIGSILLVIAGVGEEVCASIATAHGWLWPEELATRCQSLIRESLKA